MIRKYYTGRLARGIEGADRQKGYVAYMERQYTRIDTIRKILDSDLKAISDEEIKRCAYVHLYGVGQAAAFLAMKRGFDRKRAELAEIAGMLHDYAKYIYNEEEHAE